MFFGRKYKKTSRIINIIQTSKKGENHEIRIFKSFTNEEDETMVKWNKVVLELIELIKANKLCRLG